MVTRSVQPFDFATHSPGPSARAKVIAVASLGAHAVLMIYLATQQFAAPEEPAEVDNATGQAAAGINPEDADDQTPSAADHHERATA